MGSQGIGLRALAMGMCMRENFMRGSALEVGFITTTCVESMREIGLMESMMGMVWRHGQKEVDMGASIGMA